MRTLAIFVVLGVLAPASAVLWFMNEAARSQQEAARRDVSEAYRGQMRLLRDRVDEMWRERAARLESARYLPGAVTTAMADSVVFLDAAGAVVYPEPVVAEASDPLAGRADWLSAQRLEAARFHPLDAAAAYERIARGETDPSVRARAVQARIRCLLSAGRRDLAVAAIQEQFTVPSASGRDPEGRSIPADELLLGVKLAARQPELLRRFADRLAGWLKDPATPIPAAQRVFLMRELLQADPDLPGFPFLEAYRLAVDFAPLAHPSPGPPALEPSGLPGIWKLTSPNARAIALYRGDSVESAAQRVLGPPRNVRIALSRVGAAAGSDAMPAGVTMPGWQMSYYPLGPATERTEWQRKATYLWMGYAVVAALGLTGILMAGSFQRQLRLARLKTDMVAAVSHELKTPLASMRLLVDSLLEDGSGDERKTREYLELIAGENERLTRLVENFLTFARLERGRQRFAFAEVQPARVAREAVTAMGERGAIVEVDVPADLPGVHGDEDALVSVLVNLLDNAWKYTPAEKRIALRARADGQGVTFFVEDNGIGIAAAEQKRIFRGFYRVDQRLARESGGCGLGLSIVDSVVRAHRGTIAVKSAAGSGSIFRVWLPAEAKG